MEIVFPFYPLTGKVVDVSLPEWSYDLIETLWGTCYRNVSEGDGKTLEARYSLPFNVLINKMWLQIPPRRNKQTNKQTLQRCPVKPLTHKLFEVRSKTSSFPLDLGKFRLLCSGSCVPRNVNMKDIFDYKPHNSDSLVGKHIEAVFLLPLLLQTWEIHTSKSMDDISNSSFLITAVWTRSEEAPGEDEAYLRRCHEGSSVSSENSLFLETLRRPCSSILTIITHNGCKLSK